MGDRFFSSVICLALVSMLSGGVVRAQCEGSRCNGDNNCDGTVDVSELIQSVNVALEGCTVDTCQAPCGPVIPTDYAFPASGQVTSYKSGDDGDVEAGATLSYTDNGDGTLTDNNTGLTWAKKDDAGGIHDKDTRYSWNDTFDAYLAALNSSPCFAGHCDWRMPNVKELQSIIGYEWHDAAVDSAFHNSANCNGCTDITKATCSCTVSLSYWSSTTVSGDSAFAWTVNASNGALHESNKGGSEYVRAVRGGLSLPDGLAFPATGQVTSYKTGDDGDVAAGAILSYTHGGDGTITDDNTGLTWAKKDDAGGIHDKDTRYSWEDAFGTYIAALNSSPCFAGHCDWRMPNVKELQSIIDYEWDEPAVDPAFHGSATCDGCVDVTDPGCTCTVSQAYWSSTTLSSNTDFAWTLRFGNGSVQHTNKVGTAYVRAVRGGL